ncbi:MAG: hypothetical protein EBY39_10575 [Flavobacteriia bacterium]|nr:hypothetical protein [Flavobacteriia bacterium]
MRAYLIEQLRDLISNNQIRKEEAEEILELFDLEVEWKDKSEQLAYNKAQQDVEIALQGEWGE